MAAQLNPPSPLRALLLLLLAVTTSVAAVRDDAGIVVYWGQNGNERTLQQACDTGNYAYVNIAFLNNFGQGREKNLNLAAHCNDPPAGSCTYLSSHIEHCQARGIKVLISLGGAWGTYGFADEADARDFADYLWKAYLGGSSPDVRRPLGDAVLDGVDLDIEGSGATSNLYWDTLVTALSGYSTPEKKVYLAAAPQCPYPDYYLDSAITTGLLDYVWVQFYNNGQCEYHKLTSDPSDLLRSWHHWATTIKVGKLFMGLLAADGYGTGYMPTQALVNQVLPVIETYPVYGGIMLWNRYLDVLSGYSDEVKCYIRPCPGAQAA